MKRCENAEYILLGAAFALALAGYVLTAGKIADHDAFVMGRVALGVVEGKALYTEVWDNKPPLALLFYYPSQLVAPHSYLSQQIFTFLWTAVQALAIFFLLRGEKLWIRIVIAIIVLWTPLSRTDFAWGSSEDAVNGFTILLAILGYRVFRDGGISAGLWLIGGLAAGFAFHTRQPGVLFLALPAIALFISPARHGSKAQALTFTGMGSLLAFASVVSLMLLISDWTSYMEAMFNKPLQYSGLKNSISTGGIGLGTIIEPSGTAKSTLALFITLLFSKLHVIRSVLLEHFTKLGTDILFVVPILAIFLNSGWRSRLLAGLLLAVGMVTVLLPMKLFSHYHQQLIPAFAIGTLFLLRRVDRISGRAAKSLAAGLLVIILFKVVVTVESLRFDNGEQAEMKEVVRVIESQGQKDDTIFAVGENSAYIYYSTAMQPCHKIHWDKFFGWLARYLPESADSVMDSIVAQPPNWIAIDRNAHDKYLQRPDQTPEGLTRMGELLQRLNERHVYESVDEIGHWLVLKMSTHRSRNE